MDRERADRWCERGILGLVLAILVFGPLATGAVRTLEFLVIQALTLGVVLLWALRFWLDPKPKLFWPPICWAVLAFTVYAVARYLTSDIEYIARQEMIHVLVYAALFLVILNNLHRQESVQIITLTLIFLAMAIASYAIYQFMTDSNRVWAFTTPYVHRGSGTYISPNHLAGFLEMLLPIGFAYTLAGRQKPVIKVLLGYASLVMVVGLGATVSRGGWVASAVALALFFGILALRRNYRLPAFALLLALAVGAAYFITQTYHLQRRVKEAFAKGDIEQNARYEMWEATTRMWQDHFWWGVGPDHFDYCFRLYRPDAIQLRPDRAHNEYLNTLADWGTVGTLLVLSAWVALGAGVIKTWKFVRKSDNDFGSQSSNKYAFVLGATLGLLALLLHSVVDFNMRIPANAILAVTLMALLTAHLRFATQRHWHALAPLDPARFSLGLASKIAATLVLAAALSYLGWQEARHAIEYAWLERANLAPNFSTAQIALLQRAWAVEPLNPDTTHAIGEAYRVQSWEGNDNYPELAATAMQWFAKGMTLNPHEGYNPLRYGMCLDWTGRLDESAPYYQQAEQLDPNGYFTLANIGWHYVQTGQYAAARQWLHRSQRLRWNDNPIATSYLEIANRKLLENAAPK